jgi:hypothetical protein
MVIALTLIPFVFLQYLVSKTSHPTLLRSARNSGVHVFDQKITSGLKGTESRDRVQIF